MNFNWSDFADKGKIYGKINELVDLFKNKQQDILEKFSTSHLNQNLINEDNSNFNKGFEIFLETYLSEIVESNNIKYDNHIIQEAINKFKVDLFKSLNKKIYEKILCEITFYDGYFLYKLFEALGNINTYAIFKINSDNIEVYSHNELKTYLMRIILATETRRYFYYQKSEFSININDLVNSLKCIKSEKVIATIKFKESEIHIELYSKTSRSKVIRVIKDVTTDFEKDGILNELLILDHSGYFIIDKAKYNYLISQLGRFSEVLKIQMSNEYVLFAETDSKGEGNIKWEKNLLKEIKIRKDPLKNSNKIIECYFSIENLKILSHFLFDNNHLITIFTENEIPIKIKMDFKSLDKSYGLFFIAQRKIE